MGDCTILTGGKEVTQSADTKTVYLLLGIIHLLGGIVYFHHGDGSHLKILRGKMSAIVRGIILPLKMAAVVNMLWRAEIL